MLLCFPATGLIVSLLDVIVRKACFCCFGTCVLGWFVFCILCCLLCLPIRLILLWLYCLSDCFAFGVAGFGFLILLRDFAFVWVLLLALGF